MSTTPPVTFDPTAFVAEFPEFTNVQAQLPGYFARATAFFQNDTCNPAFCVGVPFMAAMLNLVTAHVASLNSYRDAAGNYVVATTPGAQPPPGIVGRINTASEGSVSVGSEYNSSGSPSEAYFIQTRYGAEFWQATAQFRTAQYVANPTVVPGTIGPGAGFVGYVGNRRGFVIN